MSSKEAVTGILTSEGNKSKRYDVWDAPPHRPVYYDAPANSGKKNIDKELAVDIVSLYVTCGLGYSPIRHIIGAEDDKVIEDVIRQHRFCRHLKKHKDAWKECRLICPGKKFLDHTTKLIVEKIATKRGTTDEYYVRDMLESGVWKDDPVYPSNDGKCPACGADLVEGSLFCHMCGKSITKE